MSTSLIKLEQRNHTIHRLKHRYGVEINQDGYDVLCSRLKKQDSFIIHQLTEHTTVHLMAIGNVQVPLVFDAETQQIKTAMKRSNLRWIQRQFLRSLRDELDSKPRVSCNGQYDEIHNH